MVRNIYMGKYQCDRCGQFKPCDVVITDDGIQSYLCEKCKNKTRFR